MVFRSCTVILGLYLLIIGPTFVLSIANDALPLHEYILGSIDRFQHERIKRHLSLHRPIPESEIKKVLDFSEGVVKQLGTYEVILKGRHLMAKEGTPSHTAMLTSWADNETLSISRQAFITAKASNYIAYKFCIRHEKTADYCADHLAKLFRTSSSHIGCKDTPYRSLKGTCNNEVNPNWGSVFSPYSRLLPSNYKDGIWEPKGKEIKSVKSAAEISNIVLTHSDHLLEHVTVAMISWANLVTYDMSHTVTYRALSTGEPVMCCVGTHYKLAPRHRHPFCLPIVDEAETKCFNYVRSMLSTVEDYRFGPAQQMNAASHFLDGSGIYGTTEQIGETLRTGSEGKLKTNYTDGHDSLPQLFSRHTSLISGEIRINTDIITAVLHTLLVREHNRISAGLAQINGKWDDEKLYQEARRIVIAEIQHITYTEWLPVLLGDKETSKKGLDTQTAGYSGIYNKNVRPSVSNSFANAAMRFVNSMVDEKLSLLKEDRVPFSMVSLHFSLNESHILSDQETLDSLVRTLATQNCQANDLSLSHGVTKYLYGSGNETGLDALSLDIQRGRDHGLPPYTEFRKLYNLHHENFDDISLNIPRDIVNDLKKAYQKVCAIDLIVGGLAEKPQKGSLLGPVFTNIIAQQMVTSRIGDRYFYDNQEQPYPFTIGQLNEIRKVTLARLLCDNSSVKKMQPQAFRKPNISGNVLVMCNDEKSIKRLNLNLWKNN